MLWNNSLSVFILLIEIRKKKGKKLMNIITHLLLQSMDISSSRNCSYSSLSLSSLGCYSFSAIFERAVINFKLSSNKLTDKHPTIEVMRTVYLDSCLAPIHALQLCQFRKMGIKCVCSTSVIVRKYCGFFFIVAYHYIGQLLGQMFLICYLFI